MSMNYSDLKIAFKEYLIELKKKSGEDFDSNSEINIFEYSSEFKDFLKKNDEFDFDSLTMQMDDLLSLDASEIDEYMEKAKEDFAKDDDEAMFFDFVSDLTSSDKMTDAVDLDGDGKISGEELQGFFATVGSNDGKDDSVSISDIFSGVKDIKNDRYKPVDLAEIKKVDEAETQAVQSSGGGGGGYGGSYSSGGVVSSEQSNEPQYDMSKYQGMSLEQLNEELTLEQNNKEKYAQEYQDAQSGNSQQVSEQKTAMDNAYEEFLELSDDTELTENITTQKEFVDSIDKELFDTNKTIIEQEAQIVALNANITNIDTQISTIDTTISGLQSQISALEATNGTEDENGNVIDNSSQIQAIQSQIDSLNQQKEQLNEQKTAAQESIDQLTESNNQLNTTMLSLTQEYQEAFNKLTEYETQLAQTSEEAQIAYDTYNQAKSNFNDARYELLDSASQNLAQSTINTGLIQDQISIVEKEQEQQEIYEKFGIGQTESSSEQTVENGDEKDEEEKKKEEDENK